MFLIADPAATAAATPTAAGTHTGAVVAARTVATPVAAAVADVVHEVTFVDGEHLVEGSRDVESHGIHLVILEVLFYFFLCEPTLVAEGKLELVAVMLGLLGAEDG